MDHFSVDSGDLNHTEWIYDSILLPTLLQARLFPIFGPPVKLIKVDRIHNITKSFSRDILISGKTNDKQKLGDIAFKAFKSKYSSRVGLELCEIPPPLTKYSLNFTLMH